MLSVGIDLGGTKIAVGLVDEEGRILRQAAVPTGKERPYREIIKDMAALTLKVIEDGGRELQDINYIGLGSPGVPDNETGTIVRNYNIDFRDTPVRRELQKYIDLPVLLENDANCAALAESIFGAARGTASSITVTLGTGVGGGIIIGGKIFSGFNHAGSELGHMVIVVDGIPCGCGRKGCWEAYSSATALIREAKNAAALNRDSLLFKLAGGDAAKIEGLTVFNAAAAGDPAARAALAWYYKFLAEGLANVINFFMPEMVVIGGGLSGQGERLLAPLRETVYAKLFYRDAPLTELRVAALGNEAGIIGAALLGRALPA